MGQICDAAELADYLDLSVIVRNALPRLSEWVSRMNGERAASARLAYRDACRISEDGAGWQFEKRTGSQRTVPPGPLTARPRAGSGKWHAPTSTSRRTGLAGLKTPLVNCT